MTRPLPRTHQPAPDGAGQLRLGFLTHLDHTDDRAGYLVEMGSTQDIFTRPAHRLTEDYITGRFG